MNTLEKIRSNAEVHGVTWAATRARKQGINIDTVLKALGLPLVGTKRQ